MALTAYIDLTTQNIKIIESPANILKKYLGSRGYAAKILYDNVGPEVEPLGPKNFLIFSTGPFANSRFLPGEFQAFYMHSIFFCSSSNPFCCPSNSFS